MSPTEESMSPRIIRMNPLPTVLLLTLAGCPLAGEWPVRADGDTSTPTSTSTSTAATIVTQGSGTDGGSEIGPDDPSSISGVRCKESKCGAACNACMEDDGCVALHDCVECRGMQCVNNCRCELGTEAESSDLYIAWVGCLVARPSCGNEFQEYQTSELSKGMRDCLEKCEANVCESNCISACEEENPEGAALLRAWEMCVNTSTRLLSEQSLRSAIPADVMASPERPN